MSLFLECVVRYNVAMPTTTRKTSKSSNNAFNLTKAVDVGRTVVKFGGIALIVLMIGRVVINGATAFWIATHPEPPPPPTQGFGALPKIDFGTNQSAAKPVTFTLELPQALPTFSDRAAVYFSPKKQLGLLSLEEANAFAARLGFQSAPIGLDEETYRWKRLGEFNAVLEMNIVTNNLRYTTDFLSRPELQISNELPSSFDAVQTTKQFLNAADLLPADLSTASGEIQLLKLSGGTFKSAVSLSDAQAVRVDLFRTPLNGYPVYTADGKTGLISAVVASIRGKPTVVELTRTYPLIDYDAVETYPLRSTEEAWQLLKNGSGYIASAQDSSTAIIRAVSLGYFESIDQDFIQPIYIFTGDANFIAYVPALADSVQTAVPAPATPVPLPSAKPGLMGI